MGNALRYLETKTTKSMGGEETGAETLRRIPSTEDDGARAALASRRSKPDEAPRES